MSAAVMDQPPERFGVLRAFWRRRRAQLVWGALGLLASYGAFELGRYDAGFRLIDATQGALIASARIRELESENARQRAQLEAADVARRVDREGYAQVEKSLGDMQSQIARLNQDLSFYRGLVQPDTLVHVKVQQMQIVPESAPGRFRLRFVLIQSGKPVNFVTGTMAMSVDGLLRGKPQHYGFAEMSPVRRGPLPYAFRYFQDYDEPLQFVAGFEPTRINVEIHSGRDALHAFRQAFVWKAQGMSLETETGEPRTAGGDLPTDTE